jgi:hypothetical protein
VVVTHEDAWQIHAHSDAQVIAQIAQARIVAPQTQCASEQSDDAGFGRCVSRVTLAPARSQPPRLQRSFQPQESVFIALLPLSASTAKVISFFQIGAALSFLKA